VTADPPLLELTDLSVAYGTGLGRHQHLAVNGVSFTIAQGETVGLVGESGAGKSSIGRAILGLARPSGGTITFQGEDVTRASKRQRRQLSRHLQAVFQDPYSSFNPTRTIGQALLEPLRQAPELSAAGRRERVADVLSSVGLSSDVLSRRPASFSGGQRQRIAIARALVAGPQLVVCDEPVSALDLSIQAQVLNLLLDLQEKRSVSYLFISHDMSVVQFLCHRVVVLNGGMIMEAGPADQVCRHPRHPYTRSLLAAVPLPDPQRQRERRLARQAARRGGVAGQAAEGCPFSARCPYAIEICRQQRPPAVAAGEVTVACHRYPAVAAQWPESTATAGPPAGPSGLTPAEPANGELR
jgi:peptide/nickel transport system ATP-binding protein